MKQLHGVHRGDTEVFGEEPEETRCVTNNLRNLRNLRIVLFSIRQMGMCEKEKRRRDLPSLVDYFERVTSKIRQKAYSRLLSMA